MKKTKTIIVTGANGNLGTATVKKFLEEGYNVVGVDAADNNLAFAKGNERFQMHSLDLANEAASAAFAEETIQKHGSIEGALLLVGGFAMGGIDKTTL